MKEGSPPQQISFFINIPAVGKDPTSCQRARQHAGFCDRQGNKTAKRMMYDLFAEFYVNSFDSKPKYTVLMGRYYPETVNEMKEKGFNVDPDSHLSSVEYIMEIKENELYDWIQDGFKSELKDVLNAHRFYYKIQLKAKEAEVIEHNTFNASRGFLFGDTFISFEDSDPNSPMFFECLNRSNPKERGYWFRTPMKRLKRLFKVMTLVEVMEKMRELANGKPWSFNQLRRYFASGIDEALELATRVFTGETDLDGNPAILHALAVGMAGKTSDEKIVGFLHNVIEDSNLEAEDLICEGFSDEVIRAVVILTHEKWRDSYDEYIDKVIGSGNRLAINVKINDLKHNIERGLKGRHKMLVKKHEDALAKIFAEIKH